MATYKSCIKGKVVRKLSAPTEIRNLDYKTVTEKPSLTGVVLSNEREAQVVKNAHANHHSTYQRVLVILVYLAQSSEHMFRVKTDKRLHSSCSGR